jgi:hypothetical protein
MALGTNNTTRLQIGSAGQFGIGGATYGTSGQVLTSGGASAAPTWATVSAGFTLATPVSASGSSVTFSGIPAGVKQVNVMFNSVLTSSNATIFMKLGTSGGLGASGYKMVRTRFTNGSTASNQDRTTFIEITGDVASTPTVSGLIIFTLQDATNNYWTFAGNLSHSENAWSWFISGSSNLISGLALTQLQIYPAAGTFSSGTLNISYI